MYEYYYQSRIDNRCQVWCLVDYSSDDIIICERYNGGRRLSMLFSNNVQNGFLNVQQKVFYACHITEMENENLYNESMKRWFAVNWYLFITWVVLDSSAAFLQFHCCMFCRKMGYFFRKNNPLRCLDLGWESRHCHATTNLMGYLENNKKCIYFSFFNKRWKNQYIEILVCF